MAPWSGVGVCPVPTRFGHRRTNLIAPHHEHCPKPPAIHVHSPSFFAHAAVRPGRPRRPGAAAGPFPVRGWVEGVGWVGRVRWGMDLLLYRQIRHPATPPTATQPTPPHTPQTTAKDAPITLAPPRPASPAAPGPVLFVAAAVAAIHRGHPSSSRPAIPAYPCTQPRPCLPRHNPALQRRRRRYVQ